MSYYTEPVFISHASRDHDSVYPIAAALDGLGSGVFYLNHPTNTSYSYTQPYSPLPSTHELFGDIFWPTEPRKSIQEFLAPNEMILQQLLFQALERCRALVVTLTPFALSSPWVQKEISYFQQECPITRGRPTIVVSMMPTSPPNFQQNMHIDGRDQPAEAVAHSIQQWLGSR